MKNSLLFLLLILSCIIRAQVTISAKKLDFGTVQTGKKDSLYISIHKTPGIWKTNVRLVSDAFSVKDTILPYTGDSILFQVYFAPKHNISYHSYLLLRTLGEPTDLAVELTGTGTYNEPYYAITQNVNEEALKDSLKKITSTGHITLGYNGARDKMFMEIDNKKMNGQGATINTLECVYTGRIVTGYTARSDSQTNGKLNTEHTWPQSLFNSDPFVCDLNHLFVTDELANNKRSNFPFGKVTNPIWDSAGSKFDGSVFEPRDVHKGKVARAMLYFATRYKDDAVTLSFVSTQESILRQWSQQFPPNSIDKKRNDDVKLAQGNRNPYIDHPEFLERITSLSGISVAPDKSKLILIEDSLTIGTNPVYFTPFKSDSVVYQKKLLVYNKGNKTITINNAAFNHSDTFAVQKFPSTILPGGLDTIIVSIKLISPQKPGVYFVREMLTINSNSLENPTIRVPYNSAVVIQEQGGIKNEQEQNIFQLYPNPSCNEFNVSSKDVLPFDIYLTNLQGEKVLQTENNRNNTTVRLENIIQGIYFVYLISEQGVSIKKITVIH